MKNKIRSTLEKIAHLHDIEILYACESGSRAWGFPSTDSDYDVRFIYKRKQNDYLSVLPIEDQLVFPIDHELDLYGWDIKKVLLLLFKSNSTPFEWLQSPIVYQEQAAFKSALVPLLASYFNARTQVFHYLGIARNALDTMEEEHISIKKLFYVLRPLLAAKWIVEKGEYPPMNILPLLVVAPKEIQTAIQQLIVDKRVETERTSIKPEVAILNFISNTMEDIVVQASLLASKRFEVNQLNAFFQKTIQ